LKRAFPLSEELQTAGEGLDDQNAEKRERTVLRGVEINIPSFLQHLSEGASRDYVNGGTIGECLIEIVDRYPRLKPRLFQAEGRLSRDLNIFLNGAHVDPDELSRPVKEEDKLHIAHVIVGG
jgi:molybdopterin synthase sulfur carrier subunit